MTYEPRGPQTVQRRDSWYQCETQQVAVAWRAWHRSTLKNVGFPNGQLYVWSPVRDLTSPWMVYSFHSFRPFSRHLNRAVCISVSASWTVPLKSPRSPVDRLAVHSPPPQPFRENLERRALTERRRAVRSKSCGKAIGCLARPMKLIFHMRPGAKNGGIGASRYVLLGLYAFKHHGLFPV